MLFYPTGAHNSRFVRMFAKKKNFAPATRTPKINKILKNYNRQLLKKC